MDCKFMVCSLIVAISLMGLAFPLPGQAAEEFALISALVGEGGNIWLPSTIIFKKGEEVKLKLRNVAQAEHGFSIDALGIKEVIKPGETKEVTVKPGSEGVLRYYCHLHPGHVGGQMLVK
jgi:heme/copper-type cytochrome/quinol oxidase subunit 2